MASVAQCLSGVDRGGRITAEDVFLAGHGLNYTNVDALNSISEIVELNIGHSIVARAALVGMDRAVRDMIALLRRR